MKALWAMPVALFAVSGCLAPDAYCDFRPVEPRCQERLASVSAEQFKGQCGATQAMAGDGRCPTEGRVAGCALGNQGDGSNVNDWYYAPETFESVMQRCVAAEGTPLVP